MSDHRIVFMRGLPGCGKSTEIQKRFPGAKPAPQAKITDPVICSMDHYFLDSVGDYVFDLKRIGAAAAFCQKHVFWSLLRGRDLIIVDNTHTQHWEMDLVKTMARAYGYLIETVDLFDGGLSDEELAARNAHGVPVEIIAQMRARWEK
jgi:predicted kinase